jgi:hypothetical protein
MIFLAKRTERVTEEYRTVIEAESIRLYAREDLTSRYRTSDHYQTIAGLA